MIINRTKEFDHNSDMDENIYVLHWFENKIYCKNDVTNSINDSMYNVKFTFEVLYRAVFCYQKHLRSCMGEKKT